MRIIFLFLTLFSTSQLFAKFKINSFYQKIVTKDPKLLNSLNREISTSKVINSTKEINIKKIAKPIPKIMAVAKIISEKDTFSEKLISSSSKPLLIVRQYSKYGDDYLKTLKDLNQNIKSNREEALKVIDKRFKSKLNIKEINLDNINEKVVDLIDRTGKRGLNLLKKLSKNSGKITLTAMAITFIAMPEEFLDLLDKDKTLQEELNLASINDENSTQKVTPKEKSFEEKLSDFQNKIEEKGKYLQEIFKNRDFKPLFILFLMIFFILYLLRLFFKKIKRKKAKEERDNINQFKDKMY